MQSTPLPFTLNTSQFAAAQPFAHCVLDDFFPLATAQALAAEFPAYDDARWFCYSNPLEEKKALNDWNAFPPLTYSVFSHLCSPEFIASLSAALGVALFADTGLHGGGWHIHAHGGRLNPHLDYSIHPKLGLQRKLNLIIYLSPELEAAHGGHLGLWQGTPSAPEQLAAEITPRFNRAVLFDTTQAAWHGMSQPLLCPPGVYRKSLAVYYLCSPSADAPSRGRVLYAPTETQQGDPAIAALIAQRAEVASSALVYRQP